MDREKAGSTARAVAFAAALLAITLNFLQPLAHAALLRDSGSLAGVALSETLCRYAGAEESQRPTPPLRAAHECCLGLAHASGLAEPPADFQPIVRVPVTVRFVTPAGIPTRPATKDGPGRARAPPFLA